MPSPIHTPSGAAAAAVQPATYAYPSASVSRQSSAASSPGAAAFSPEGMTDMTSPSSGSFGPSNPASRAGSPRMADRMLPWHWSAEEVASSPSVEDGMTHAEVLERKHHAYVFIEEMRAGIKFQPIVASTAMVLYHRFYHYQSMKQFKWKEMAWCCLFAAFKIEEKVLKMESLLKWSHHVSCKLMKMSREEIEANKLDVQGRQFFEMKERLQFNERVLLQTIGFEVDIKQIGFHVITLVKTLKQKAPLYTSNWVKSVAKVALEWSICSMGSELCLKYKPEVIATAFVYGAAHDLFGALEHPSETTKMWELWDGLKTSTVNEKLLHDIMVELYTYCALFKEPRAYWRAEKEDGVTTDAVAPPKDPAWYDPDPRVPPSADAVAAAAVAVAAAASGAGASSSTPSASAAAAAESDGNSGAAPSATASPVGASAATSSVSSAAAGAHPAASDAMETEPRSISVTHTVVAQRPSPAPALVAPASGGSMHPTPPRTADNTPRGSPLAEQPVSPRHTIEVEAMKMHAAAVAVSSMPASTSNGEEHCAREIAMRVAMASEKRRIEEVTPGGGDESMDPDDVGWPRSPKRMREDS